MVLFSDSCSEWPHGQRSSASPCHIAAHRTCEQNQWSCDPARQNHDLAKRLSGMLRHQRAQRRDWWPRRRKSDLQPWIRWGCTTKWPPLSMSGGKTLFSSVTDKTAPSSAIPGYSIKHFKALRRSRVGFVLPNRAPQPQIIWMFNVWSVSACLQRLCTAILSSFGGMLCLQNDFSEIILSFWLGSK